MTSDGQSCRKTYSAEFVASNDDLLTQILLQLPIKSIAKFKSVSKHWLSLISTTPQFALSKPVHALLLHHRNKYSHLDLLPLHRHETPPPFFPFRSLPFLGDGSLRGIQSCNGLLLCHRRINSNTIYYHIYNPTTTKYATIPPPPPQLGDSKAFAGLAFDPSCSPYYKVVCFHLFRSTPRLCQVAIYSSETRKWRLSGDSFVPNFHMRSHKKGVFWNRAIYWISQRGSFRFHMEEETIMEVPMPPISDNRERWVKYFGVSWGHLYLINSADSLRGHLNIYEMEGDCSCWCLKHTVEVGDDLAAPFPEIVWRDRFNGFSIMFLAQPNADDDQDPFLVIQIRSQVVCYNINSRDFRKIYDLPSNQSGSSYMCTPRTGAYQYIESLSPVS